MDRPRRTPARRDDAPTSRDANTVAEDAATDLGDVVSLTLDDLASFRAAIILAEESLGRALHAVKRHEGADSHLAQEIGSALEALATTDEDLRRAGLPWRPDSAPPDDGAPRSE